MKIQKSSQGGWLLVGLIILISAVLVAMTGIALAMVQSQRVVSMRENDTEAAYLAQAGIMQELYNFRDGTGVGSVGVDQVIDAGPTPGLGDDDVFVLGGKAADFLLANMISARVDRANLSGQRDS